MPPTFSTNLCHFTSDKLSLIENFDEAVICPKCGVPQNNVTNNTTMIQEEDKPNAGLNIIAFLIPLAGIIIYAINISRDSKEG